MAATVPREQQPSTPTVSGCAQLCFKSFQECLDKAASIHSRELSLVEDQLARFSLWTANISVFAPSRGSLDHRLREAPDVQDVVTGLLEALEYQVKGCSQIIDSLSPRTSGGLLSTVDEKFDQALRGIASEISLLHRFSNTIRRASKQSQNHKAAEAFQIRDEDGNNVESFLKELFANHIRDRFPSVSDSIRQRLADSMLLRRKRILYRRSRHGKTSIRPQEVPYQPSITRPQAQPAMNLQQEPSKPQVTVVPSQSAIQSVAQTATTLSPESYQKASSPSVVSTSKTVALSGHEHLRFPSAPYGGLLRKYNKLKEQLKEERRAFLESLDINSGFFKNQGVIKIENIQFEKIQFQKILDKHWDDYLRQIGEIMCPFCFYALPAQNVVDEKKWKLHVKNDLDPYVCLFEECDSAGELYSHSHTWLNHMRAHAMRWRCVSKSHDEFVGTTRDEYLSHMKAAHPGKLTDAQLGVMADRNARVAVPLFKSCPLCGVENVDDNMEDHIVGHMRFLALKSLPSYEEGTEGLDESDSQDDSLATSRPQSRSTVKNELERHTCPPDSSSLGQFVFEPPSILPLEDPILSFDPSTKYVELRLFHDVPKENRRLFEWGFIPEVHGSSTNPEDDPVLRAFLERDRRETKEESRKSIIKMDPDCTICHAPANHDCDCEAKGLEVAINQAEERMMSSMYADIRSWVRQKSQDLVIGVFEADLARLRAPNLAVQRPSQQEINEAWQAACQKYPETLEAYFSLVDLSVPDDGDPAVWGPPLKAPGSLNKRMRDEAEVLESDKPPGKDKSLRESMRHDTGSDSNVSR
ncbi:hypothetical protein F5X96DRAFT_680485 [Biscogniauxia mediterranea]|nr:hypothetical protein F5X96DRAFT_680485 [Biscogniauxia mediterranea]